jgi:hypothetical protein
MSISVIFIKNIDKIDESRYLYPKDVDLRDIL